MNEKIYKNHQKSAFREVETRTTNEFYLFLDNAFTNIKSAVVKNKTYLLGLLFSVLLPLIIMLLYWNKSISNYDGWYNLYAQDILEGKIPYLDFHFLMPPFYLYCWTLIQKIFGNSIIVFHAASLIVKCILSGVIFHTIQRFYNKRISFVACAISSVIMLCAPFDNCTLSYNEFVTLIGFILLNILLTFTDILINKQKISYGRVIWASILCAILFLTKQTHGVIVPFATIVLTGLILFKNVKLRTMLKIFGVYIASFITTVFINFIPLMHSNSLIKRYIENVYMGVSAKGSPFAILQVPIRLFSDFNYIYPIFIASTLIFVVFILKRYYNVKMFAMEKADISKILPPNVITFGIYLITILLTVLYNQLNFKKCMLYNNTHVYYINILGFFCELAIFYMTLFFLVRYVLLDKKKDATRLLLFGIITSIALSTVLSSAFPYFIFYAFAPALAILLNYKFRWSFITEGLIYVLSVLIVSSVTLQKLSLPFAFHGWLGMNTAVERKISKLDSLKGFRLSKGEVEMIEKFYDVLNKYLNKDDRIFCFINNTVFYNLLNRKPFYGDYYNLYWDICPEYQAHTIFDYLSTPYIEQLPPAIVYLQNSEQNIIFHESLFRGGNKRNAQRGIDILIKRRIANGTYAKVLEYDANKYFKNVNKDLGDTLDTILSDYKQLLKLQKEMNYDEGENIENWDKILELEDKIYKNNQILTPVITDNTRFILEAGYKLVLLIRSDVYDKNNTNE